MKKLERTKKSIDIYGTVYDLSRPSYRQAQELGKQSANKNEEETQSLMLDFLENMGIPKSVTLDMEVEHVGMLIEYLMPAKKK